MIVPTEAARQRALSGKYKRLRARRMEVVWWRFCEAAVLHGRRSADELLRFVHPASRANVIRHALRNGGLPGFRFISGLEAADHGCDRFAPTAAGDRHRARQGTGDRIRAMAARAARGQMLFDQEAYCDQEEED